MSEHETSQRVRALRNAHDIKRELVKCRARAEVATFVHFALGARMEELTALGRALGALESDSRNGLLPQESVRALHEARAAAQEHATALGELDAALCKAVDEFQDSSGWVGAVRRWLGL